ncbi:MAG: metalloregulator ArsR/SmtB family transcription factor [Chloroflexota bacterium]
MKDLIKAMKALSDETRLRILNLLMERECCVCEVMQVLNISQSRASRNLGILEKAGLLRSRRVGAWILYALDTEAGNRYAASVVSLLKDTLVRDDSLGGDRERLKQAQRVGPSCVCNLGEEPAFKPTSL